MDYDFDCVVVGGGVAGLSAAMVLGRARRRTLVLDRRGQSNRAAAHVGGLLGHDGTPPEALYELARAQVAAYDAVAVRDAEAVDARADGDGFVVALGDDGGEVRARVLILAMGMDYEVPDVPGFREHWGRAVSTARSATAGRAAISRSWSMDAASLPIAKPRCSRGGLMT